ncbi:OLC1v1026499C1 [Oldenlandia corymbosa var. corymbosa]|uniref:OLC1v1026499C1 n=1 Tax=Oldenlandia corymbosa var. corymbosa TaxID=529605 RepID=A0AAV1C7M5_OLDCO|nr:OLC1v1026499C1 [Oldenlandia corymbosa var. corymbosa]
MYCNKLLLILAVVVLVHGVALESRNAKNSYGFGVRAAREIRIALSCHNPPTMTVPSSCRYEPLRSGSDFGRILLPPPRSNYLRHTEVPPSPGTKHQIPLGPLPPPPPPPPMPPMPPSAY